MMNPTMFTPQMMGMMGNQGFMEDPNAAFGQQ
jgi:hypothetical protein